MSLVRVMSADYASQYVMWAFMLWEKREFKTLLFQKNKKANNTYIQVKLRNNSLGVVHTIPQLNSNTWLLH